MDKTHYYRYIGFFDGSGCPNGYVIKCYTDEQYERFTKSGLRFVLMESEDKECI